MAKAAQAMCTPTAPPEVRRVTVGGAMRYLASCSAEERAAALARADAAFAAGAHNKTEDSPLFRAAVPPGRVKLYLKNKLEAVIFEVLDDRRADRGTMRATCDGSYRRAFNFRTDGMIIEPESSGNLILAGIPRRTRRWVNEQQPNARLGWANNFTLEGERSDDERALWELLFHTASLTNYALDLARRPLPKKRTLLLSRSQVA